MLSVAECDGSLKGGRPVSISDLGCAVCTAEVIDTNGQDNKLSVFRNDGFSGKVPI